MQQSRAGAAQEAYELADKVLESQHVVEETQFEHDATHNHPPAFSTGTELDVLQQ